MGKGRPPAGQKMGFGRFNLPALAIAGTSFTPKAGFFIYPAFFQFPSLKHANAGNLGDLSYLAVCGCDYRWRLKNGGPIWTDGLDGLAHRPRYLPWPATFPALLPIFVGNAKSLAAISPDIFHVEKAPVKLAILCGSIAWGGYRLSLVNKRPILQSFFYGRTRESLSLGALH